MTNTNGLAFQGDQISSLYPKYWKSVSPRIGLSYAANQSTVVRAGFGFFFDTPNLNPFLDNRPGNAAPNGVQGNPGGPDPVYTLDVGEVPIQPNVPIFPAGTCTTDSPCGVFSVSNNFRSAYNMNYSLNLEQSLAPNVIAQIGYVGSQGRRLLSLRDINQAAPGVYDNNSERQAARPYYNQYPTYGNINQIESIGTSNYNSLQTQLRLQNWHNISSSIIYTWSHTFDEVTNYRGVLPQDNFNFKGDYGNSDFDTRNTFVSQVTYEIPGASWGPKELTHGWQLNSLLSFHGGQPFTVHASGDISGTNEDNDRAVQVGSVRRGFQGQKPNANWLDPSAFIDPTPGTFGTTRRNGYYGPGYSDVDFSVFKNTKIKERVNIQFRAEMFNLFNRNNFAPPGGGFVNVGGNFSLTDTIGDYNGAPGIGAGEPFNTQFGLKVIF